MNRQAGFTLIEVIVVIVILGILAVTAAPKFIDIQDDARLAAAEGVSASVKTAMSTAYAKALVTNATADTGTITVDGGDVDLVYGYPAATSTGIGALIELDGDWTAAAGTAAGTFTFTDTICSFIYTAAKASTATPPVITPASVGDITGC